MFNIKTATNEVIDIFKQQADSVGIDIIVIFDDDTLEDLGYMIVTDK